MNHQNLGLYPHLYRESGWKCIPILLSLHKVVEKFSYKALNSIIMDAMLTHGGLKAANIAKKMVCSGSDGVALFLGAKTRTTTQFQEKHAPYTIGMNTRLTWLCIALVICALSQRLRICIRIYTITF